MSGPLAVATVTSALQNLLTAAVKHVDGGADISTRSPDKAREAPFGAKNQLNVFLFHTSLDPAWRNQDMPGIHPGESSWPPLPLVLHYIISAYGQGDDEVKAQSVLGHALSVLHDHPILGPDEFAQLLAGSDLERQSERVRITPQLLSIDEMTKLWTAFQTSCRISACYEVSVVLLSSTQAARTPLPVLTRGEDDIGVVAQTGAVPPFPTITAVVPPNRQSAVVPGDLLTLSGHHLLGATHVLFSHPLFELLFELPPEPDAAVRADEITLRVPADVAVGVSTVAVVFREPDKDDRVSNGQPLAVAVRITNGLPATPAIGAGGVVTLELTCEPKILTGQQVYLLLGERPVPASEPPNPAVVPRDRLKFVIAGLKPGDNFLVRVRVDGVDSLLEDRRVAPPVFIETQRVTVR